MNYYEFYAMNSDIVLGAEGKAEAVKSSFKRAHRYITESEVRFSRFLAESELSSLNRHSGSWFEISADLFELLHLSKQFYNQTAGMFNPAVLDALEHAGYDRSMDEIRTTGDAPLPTHAKPVVPQFEDLRMDVDHNRVFLPEGMHLDLGGIAKGWIAEQAARLMAEQVSTCVVNAGGDMFLIGLPADQHAWQVGIENPLEPEYDIATLMVTAGAVATSSVVKRSWSQGGVPRHHLIDPRSGEPAASDWLTVTVLAAHAANAEVFAKAMLIAGREKTLALAAQNPDIIALAIDREVKLWGTPNSKEVMYVANTLQS
jgi:thiamine biosynthesis lipoprotein